MANMSNSPITQVSQVPTHTNLQPQLLTRLFLDLRGRRFEVDRETIMNLPESVLLCLFPNGLVLSRQSVALSDGGGGGGGGDEDDEEVYGVDVRKEQSRIRVHTNILSSLTPTVSNSYSPSFEMLLITFMGHQRTQVFSVHNNTFWSHLHRSLVPPLHKIHYFQNRLSLFSGKNLNTFLFRPRIVRLPQIRMVLPMSRCWKLNAGRVTTSLKSATYSRLYNEM